MHRVKDIWSLVQDLHRAAEQDEASILEVSIIFVGSKNSGKTTLLNRYLDKSTAGEVQPSTALEYTFGRRSRSTKMEKDIIHAWELAGGVSLAKLFEVTLTRESIRNALVVVVLDLAKPEEIIQTLVRWLDIVRARTKEILLQLQKEKSLVVSHLLQQQERWMEGNPDKARINAIGIPVLIVGSKYDVLESQEWEKRKILCRTLRYIAHMNGCALAFVTSKDEQLITRFRGALSQLLFAGSSAAPTTATAGAKSAVVDYTKPLFIPRPGLDSIASIGKPTELKGRSFSSEQELWIANMDLVFPPRRAGAGDSGEDRDVTSSEALVDDHSWKYPEPAVDSMRAEKECVALLRGLGTEPHVCSFSKELEQYRKAVQA